MGWGVAVSEQILTYICADREERGFKSNALKPKPEPPRRGGQGGESGSNTAGML